MFPPIVYYKVYLRNAVTDLGAFAPRDYTVGKPDQFYMLRRHNDGCQNEVRAQSVRDVTHQVDTSLWYHRFENNGWRPIANKHLHAHDQVTRSTAARRNPDFHHVCEVRKMVATTRREHKKRQWMERMYRPSLTDGASRGNTLNLGNKARAASDGGYGCRYFCDGLCRCSFSCWPVHSLPPSRSCVVPLCVFGSHCAVPSLPCVRDL